MIGYEELIGAKAKLISVSGYQRFTGADMRQVYKVSDVFFNINTDGKILPLVKLKADSLVTTYEGDLIFPFSDIKIIEYGI